MFFFLLAFNLYIEIKNQLPTLLYNTINLMAKLFGLLTFLSLALCATCWWQVGHMAVAQIAQKRLQTLGQMAAFNKFNDLVKAFENLTDGRSNSFVQASVWSDDIKQTNATYFDNYHFTDVVYDPQYMFVAMTQPQKDVNSINVASSCLTVLKTNKEGITFERAFMARYLLHLVGDIHQPLHSVTMYNSTLKKGDLGGNLIQILTLQKQQMNLHAYMDSMALQQKSGQRFQRPLTSEGKAYLNKLADTIMGEYPPQHFGNDINILSSHAWTIESYNAAVQKVYPFVFKNKQITQQWQDQIFKLCRQRVALAGYRLANAIISIYK